MITINLLKTTASNELDINFKNKYVPFYYYNYDLTDLLV